MLLNQSIIPFMSVDRDPTHVIVINFLLPVMSPELPERDREASLAIAKTILSGATFTGADLPVDTRRYLAENPTAAIGFETIGGMHIYPTFQFDDKRTTIDPLVIDSAVRFGSGVGRAQWWLTPNEDFGGAIPARLLVDGIRLNELDNAINPKLNRTPKPLNRPLMSAASRI